MTLYLLDTATIVDFSKGRVPTRQRVRAALARGDRLATCAAVLAEFYTGVSRGERPDWDTFVDALVYLETTREAAEQAGVFRRRYRSRGIQIATTDALIAATAISNAAVLVTENPRDFPMPEVTRESWRAI